MKWSCTEGGLTANHSGQTARLVLTLTGANGGEVETVPLSEEEGYFLAVSPRCRISLKREPDEEGPGGRQRFLMTAEALVDVRIELRLEFCNTKGDAWHVLPGFLFGDNNLSISEAGHFPNLSSSPVENETVSPEWQMRVDRNAAPIAMAFAQGGGHIALAGPPYTDLPKGGFIKNGLIAALPGVVGFAVGYRNAPSTFINKDSFGEPTEHLLPAGVKVQMPLDLFFQGDSDRSAASTMLREVYTLYYEAPQATVPTEACIAAIPEAAIADSWFAEQSAFTGVKACGVPEEVTYRQIGGRAIAWVGGVNVAYPLLLAGTRLEQKEWIDVATKAFDRVAANVNPATGLFFDAYNEDWTPSVNNWWSGNTNRDLHSAYTNAEAACYLLRGSMAEKERTGSQIPRWHEPALTACQTILDLQRKDGHCGYAYFSDRAEVASWDGFAGCWWAVAFCEAYHLTEEGKYLEAAVRAVNCYWPQVDSFHVWGTPMDTWKANDEEGVLAFVQASRRLHELTGEAVYLDMLSQGAEYEFLWRYLYNVRPDAEPLQSSGWHSCGGSITSVSNPHIHPMGLLIAGDLKYLAEQTGDRHFADRLSDSLAWARNCLEIYPDKTGYGRFGWTGERYCHSDGLLITKYVDGRPASTELSFNLWAASAMLEGFLST